MACGLVLVQHWGFAVSLRVKVVILALLERVHPSLWYKGLLRDDLPEIRLLLSVLIVKLAFAMLLVGLLFDHARVEIHAVHLISFLQARVCSAITILLLDCCWRSLWIRGFAVHIRSKFAHVQLNYLMADLFGLLNRPWLCQGRWVVHKVLFFIVHAS